MSSIDSLNYRLDRVAALQKIPVGGIPPGSGGMIKSQWDGNYSKWDGNLYQWDIIIPVGWKYIQVGIFVTALPTKHCIYMSNQIWPMMSIENI